MTIRSGCVATSSATRPISKSHGVSPATTSVTTATRSSLVSLLASRPRRRTAASTSTAEKPRATSLCGPVTRKTPESR